MECRECKTLRELYNSEEEKIDEKEQRTIPLKNFESR